MGVGGKADHRHSQRLPNYNFNNLAFLKRKEIHGCTLV